MCWAFHNLTLYWRHFAIRLNQQQGNVQSCNHLQHQVHLQMIGSKQTIMAMMVLLFADMGLVSTSTMPNRPQSK